MAIQYGYPIIATPGIFRWCDEWTELLKDKEVILVPDNEVVSKRKSPAYLQAKTLSKCLPNLKVAILTRDKNQKKVDLDTYILTKGVKSFDRIIKGAIDVTTYLEIEDNIGMRKVCNV